MSYRLPKWHHRGGSNPTNAFARLRDAIHDVNLPSQVKSFSPDEIAAYEKQLLEEKRLREATGKTLFKVADQKNIEKVKKT